MPRKKDDFAYLWDMYQAAKLVKQFSSNQTFYSFVNDNMRRSAIERQIEIVGEAAYHVSCDIKNQHSEIPWNKIISTRHIIAHEYDNLLYEILWNICTDHMDSLIEQLEKILPPEIPEKEL